ncbi:unnamed protein product [Acanthoscelides obtectus]|uniref:Uncharacterized protein n=1 Tax=Acanthoscelides obtectus TaxID=200917 RepID=A0A9P0LNN0_ACAOB|nr:unnamed protein product [Acanthoscelides obtectus]CAK1650218.1 hypothetical protein AOBTE_LOCUS16694 [Acanthoscelides obtectus]
MKEVIAFFKASAKRNTVLKSKLDGYQIHSMCETQWTERHDSVLQFESKFEKIVETAAPNVFRDSKKPGEGNIMFISGLHDKPYCNCNSPNPQETFYVQHDDTFTVEICYMCYNSPLQILALNGTTYCFEPLHLSVKRRRARSVIANNQWKQVVDAVCSIDHVLLYRRYYPMTEFQAKKSY